MIYFQWLTDDMFNTVSVLKNIELEEGEMYLNFVDGTRCNKKFARSINEEHDNSTFVIQIEHPSKLWTAETYEVGGVKERWEKGADGETYCVEQEKPGKICKRFIRPRRMNLQVKPYYEYDNIETEEISTPVYETIKPVQPQMQPIKKHESVIGELCNKAKKINVDVETIITLNIPPISLFNVVKESFENGEEEFLEYVMNSLDYKDIFKNALTQTIHNLYAENGKNE